MSPDRPDHDRPRRFRVLLAFVALFVPGLLTVGGILMGIRWYRSTRAPISGPTGPLKIAPLTTSPSPEMQPALSDDGRQVAFVSGQDIYVKRVDHGEPLRLTSDPAPEDSPAWSPDGRQVAFFRRLPEGRALVIVPASGGAERRVGDLSPALAGFGLAWSPNGKVLAMPDESAPRGANAIFLQNIETGTKRRVTNPASGTLGDWMPAFSPDGAVLAFVRTDSPAQDDVYLVSTAGGEPRRLTADSRPVRGLAWSVDGRSIIFSSNRSGGYSLWRVRATVARTGFVVAAERIALAGGSAVEPTIARKGHRLAYADQSAGDLMLLDNFM